MSVFFIKPANAVFIHVPKTAGTSIRRGYFNGDYLGPRFDYPDEWKPFFSFAFVRNPYDRLISAWKMFTEGTTEFRSKRLPKMGLEDFLKVVMDNSISFELGETYVWEEHVRHHTLPQTHDFNCLEHADFIGRYEALEEDFAQILNHLSLAQPHQRLPKRHVSKHGDFREYFSDRSLETTNSYFNEDFETLNYSKRCRL